MDREKNELVKEEGRQHGSPGIGIYVAYIRAAGGICLFLVSDPRRTMDIAPPLTHLILQNLSHTL